MNTIAILVGCLVAVAIRWEMSSFAQVRLRWALGLVAVFLGFKMMAEGVFGAGWLRAGLNVLVMFASVFLGGFIGTAIRIQQRIGALAKIAERKFARALKGETERFSEGFVTCTILFCVGPMTLIGAFNDGLYGDSKLLLLKSVMDGISAMAFAKVYGWGVGLSAVPVFVFQGTISLLAALAGKELLNDNALDAISASGGFLILAIALLMFGLRKLPVADYMPALIVAPALAWILF